MVYDASFVKGINSLSAHFLMPDPDFDYSYGSFLLWTAMCVFLNYSLAVPPS